MSASTVTEIPIAELREPVGSDAYPRLHVDPIHVRRLADALRASATLPPIVVDAASHEIVDGVHRTQATRMVHGPEATIAAELVSYPDDTARWLDAVERNSAHGLRLTTVDMVRVARLSEERGVSRTVVARVLRVPEERVTRLNLRITTVAASPPQTLELKRSTVHFSGQTVTPEQAAGIRKAPGTSYRLIAQQLRDALRLGLVADSAVMRAEIAELGEAIAAWLADREISA